MKRLEGFDSSVIFIYFFTTQLFGGSASCRRKCSRVLPVVPEAYSADLLEVLLGTSGSIDADWTTLNQGTVLEMRRQNGRKESLNSLLWMHFTFLTWIPV